MGSQKSASLSAGMRLRLALAYVAATGVALGVDAFVRFWSLPRWFRDERARARSIDKGTRFWGSSLLRIVSWAMRLTVTVEGTVPRSGRYIIVSNHQSSMDIPLVIWTFRRFNVKFVAMEQLRRGKPSISIVLRNGGSVFVSQRNLGADLKAITKFAKNLERLDACPVLFPAGGLERDLGERPFHFAGLEVVRRHSGLPILPVAIEGWAASPSLGLLSRIAGARVTIRVFDPIPPDQVESDVRETYARMEREIYAAVAELRRAAAGGSETAGLAELTGASPGTSPGTR